MSKQLTITFTTISGICCIILVTVCIRYILALYHGQYNGKLLNIDPLVKKCATISLFGYTAFVLIAFILDLIASLWYIPSININYTKILCQLQTFNIAFFMIGKLSMYVFFMVLVHVSFKDSYFAYSPKKLGLLAISFFLIMCIIGGFYMIFLFVDFSAVESILSPKDCLEFNVSTRTRITIYTGATFDGMWSFMCLLLFCFRLNILTNIMRKQSQMARKDVLKLEKKYNPDYEGDSTNSNSRKRVQSDSTATDMAALDNSMVETKTQNSSDIDRNESNDHETVVDSKAEASTPKGKPLFILNSLQVRMNSISVQLGTKKKKKKQPTVVQRFLPVMLKLTILSTWCALSTITLGFSLWTVYPSLSSVIDSTINAICVYLSFGFTRDLYEMLCFPFISCKRCVECMTVIKEVHRLEKSNVVYHRSQHSVLG